MHDDALKRDWRELRHALRRRFDRLDEADLSMIDGDREYLELALRERYSWPPARARREAARALRALVGATGRADAWSDARRALEPGAAKLREGLHELALGLRTLRGDALGQARERLHERLDAVCGATADAAHDGGVRARRALERVETFVRERPLTALGLAAAAGWLLLGRR